MYIRGDHAELVVGGRLDVRSAADARTVLHSAVDDGAGDLVLDLAALDSWDATGLGVIMGAHRRVAAAAAASSCAPYRRRCSGSWSRPASTASSPSRAASAWTPCPAPERRAGERRRPPGDRRGPIRAFPRDQRTILMRP